MTARRLPRRIFIVIPAVAGFFLVLFAIFAIWAADTLGPIATIGDHVAPDDYTIIDGNLVFAPQGDPKSVGIVLYPGAKVEPLSYGAYALGLAQDGYLVCILDVAFHLAIFDADKAEDFIALHPEIGSWYVGGHSMGGVAAAMYADDHRESVDGLILLGSYPAGSNDLSEADLDVLSIYAEFDGLTLLSDIEASRALLPADATFEMITGGNHAGFGLYGAQAGDGTAEISALAQQTWMILSTLAFLEQSGSSAD